MFYLWCCFFLGGEGGNQPIAPNGSAAPPGGVRKHRVGAEGLKLGLTSRFVSGVQAGLMQPHFRAIWWIFGLSSCLVDTAIRQQSHWREDSDLP